MRYRITGSRYRRSFYPVAAVLVIVLLVIMSRTDPNGHTPTNLVLFSVLGVWAAVFGVRGWRSATLLASENKVTVRQLLWTTSWEWAQIDGFTIEKRSIPWPWLPLFRVTRDVLGVRLRDGRVSWLIELSCRPAAKGSGDAWLKASVEQLNELAEIRTPRTGV